MSLGVKKNGNSPVPNKGTAWPQSHIMGTKQRHNRRWREGRDSSTTSTGRSAIKTRSHCGDRETLESSGDSREGAVKPVLADQLDIQMLTLHALTEFE